MRVVDLIDWNFSLLFITAITVIYWAGLTPYGFLLNTQSESPIALALGVLLYPLGHAEFSHWFVNAAALCAFAPRAEVRFGTRLVLRYALATSVICGLLVLVLRDGMLMGASGVAYFFFGLMLAYYFCLGSRIWAFFVPFIVSFFVMAEIWAIGLEGNYATEVHLVSLAAGLVLGYLWQDEALDRQFSR
ncbi:membrane associated rhomboid family serine protease [Natronocella acetinitrilica]|uniref:Membrane associated rhomboid family serine protease n=1 Tax=Natronocella acetinitrilica TaxID=414046 RepID=A0AAE3G208_9GAMM|nr:membrane associated rhomboid family serine protease [Natronocella acetinitrilica]